LFNLIEHPRRGKEKDTDCSKEDILLCRGDRLHLVLPVKISSDGKGYAAYYQQNT